MTMATKKPTTRLIPGHATHTRTQESYMGAPTDGSAREGSKCEARVLRGGSWDSNPQIARSASHGRLAPADRGDVSGFRLARTLP